MDWAATRATVLPDMDYDGDVDQTDFGRFQFCYSDSIGQHPPGCEAANFNGDDLLDLTDFQIFLACVSGPDVPALSSCDDAYQ
jgi:hypothetical protein